MLIGRDAERSRLGDVLDEANRLHEAFTKPGITDDHTQRAA
jgi:hypothetical protein